MSKYFLLLFFFFSNFIYPLDLQADAKNYPHYLKKIASARDEYNNQLNQDYLIEECFKEKYNQTDIVERYSGALYAVIPYKDGAVLWESRKCSSQGFYYGRPYYKVEYSNYDPTLGKGCFEKVIRHEYFWESDGLVVYKKEVLNVGKSSSPESVVFSPIISRRVNRRKVWPSDFLKNYSGDYKFYCWNKAQSIKRNTTIDQLLGL